MNGVRGALVAALVAILAPAAVAQTAGAKPSIWDLRPLGRHAVALPTAQFADFACGTTGGPPSTPLSGWHEYGRCAPDRETGLREVYFRYDDEDEYWALANNLRREVFGGTLVFSHPVIVSGLFSDDGFLLGVRIVTDGRAEEEVRRKAVTLLTFFLSLYGDAGFRCEGLPPAADETPAGAAIIKERCVAESPERKLIAKSYFCRKAGRAAFDPRVGGLIPTEGQFRSETRLLELYLGSIADRDAKVAQYREWRPQPAALVQQARDCPACDLRGAQLKRADLRNANLEGANLHGALLAGASLRGANLKGTNLNKADLKRADLSDAVLTDAMGHAAHFDGANARGADFTTVAMQRAEFLSANLSGANLTQADLWEARFGGANLCGSRLYNTWLVSARPQNAQLGGAAAERIVLYGALLGGPISRAPTCAAPSPRRTCSARISPTPICAGRL